MVTADAVHAVPVIATELTISIQDGLHGPNECPCLYQRDLRCVVSGFLTRASVVCVHKVVCHFILREKEHLFRVSTKMRLALLLLLLSVCVSAGVFSKLGERIKELLGGEGSVADRFKARIKKLFNNTRVLKIRQKLIEMKNKIKKTLKLSPQTEASLEERLKKLRPIEHVQAKEEGDTIEEINQKSNIGELLFQSDIVLTTQQLHDIEEDVEEEIAEGNNRTKRQAFRDGRYPNTIWSNGVNYYFDYSASQKVRSVFKKAVREWEKDTCINMRENERGNVLKTRLECLPRMGAGPMWADLAENKTCPLGAVVNLASFNKKPTMVPFDTNHQETLGSRFISFYDLLMLNTHYNCLVSDGKPGPMPQPKATTALPVRPQPRVTTPAPRPPVVVTSKPGTNGGDDFGGSDGFGGFGGFGGFDRFFCRDSLGCESLKRQNFCTSSRFPEQMRKAMCPKMCGYCK
ncbi:shTK domain protein [Ancylostoma caninum]|uniref:ShTK domain protein n=1 Tax=Ancylostoma caninum TaxID=29170 RepID=A0A368G6U8_ANCCA|nr:shTK domain protein [Ancylostoma caninum]